MGRARHRRVEAPRRRGLLALPALDAGVAARDEIARRFVAADDDEEKLETVRSYLRDNIECVLDDRRVASLNRFYEKANELGVVPATRPLRFYEGTDSR